MLSKPKTVAVSMLLSFLLVLQWVLPVAVYAEPLPAPLIDPAHAPVFPAINEDSTGGDGVLVSALVDSSITSYTGQYGIGVYAVTGNGAWEAYYDGTWWSMDPLSPQTASMLKSDVKLRFVPATDWHGTATITYRAWDLRNDEGPNDLSRTKHDVTVNGGDTAYSADAQTASITVEPVNDAPRPIFPMTPKLLQFDGSSTYVTVNNLHLKGEMTFEAWVYNENPNATWSRLFDFGNGAPGQNIMVGFYSNSGHMFLHNYAMNNSNGEIIVDEPFPASQWVHVEVIIDENGIGYIYWDGVLKKSGSVGTIVDTPRAINYIGRSHWGQDAYFKGKIRDVRFWDTARTPQQLDENKNRMLTGHEAGLVGYMPMLEGKGDYLNDLTGKEISGNIIESAWVDDSSAPLAVSIMENTDTAELLYGAYILDPDAEDTSGGQITVELEVPQGSIQVAAASGISIIAGSNGSAALTLRGSKTAINQALGQLKYTPPLNFYGLTYMDVRADDEGNTGAGGPLTSDNRLYVTVLPIAPSATGIIDQVLFVDESTAALPFTLSGGIVPAGQMILSVHSSNETLVPLQGIVLGGQGANRTVRVTPAAGQSGLAKITITVSDGRLERDISFQVLVLDEDDAEDWIEGWYRDLTDDDDIFVPGDQIRLRADTDLLTDRVVAKLGNYSFELTLRNATSFIWDGYKEWILITGMPAVAHGEQMIEFIAYHGSTVRSPESADELDDNYYTMNNPAPPQVSVPVIPYVPTTVTLPAASQEALASVTKLSLPLDAKVYTAKGVAVPGTYTVDNNGKLSLSRLPEGSYQLVVAPRNTGGELLAGQLLRLVVDNKGQASLTEELIDPFGIITDSLTGAAVPGVRVALYWSDTELNRSKGRTPGTEVKLPGLPGFTPNDNANPQISSATGEYAWMVPAFGDYYILAEADGYTIFDSRLDKREETIGLDSYIKDGFIHVGTTIVPYSFEIDPALLDSGVHDAYLRGFPEGAFRPDDGLTRGQLATILSRIQRELGAGQAFAGYRDVSATHWAADAIALASEQGWLRGYGDGSFAPERKVTRAELVQALANLAGLKADAPSGFSDVDDHWAADAVSAAADAGWIGGYEDGRFRPDAAVTRAETVTIVNRYLNRQAATVLATEGASWSDVAESHWAFADIREASHTHGFRLYATGVEEWTTP